MSWCSFKISSNEQLKCCFRCGMAFYWQWKDSVFYLKRPTVEIKQIPVNGSDHLCTRHIAVFFPPQPQCPLLFTHIQTATAWGSRHALLQMKLVCFCHLTSKQCCSRLQCALNSAMSWLIMSERLHLNTCLRLKSLHPILLQTPFPFFALIPPTKGEHVHTECSWCWQSCKW